MNEQAVELNKQIESTNPAILKLLSERGKNSFFPKEGILAQTADAKDKSINATIGIAIDDNGIPMHLESTKQHISLEPKEIYPYAPSQGLPQLRKKWNDSIKEKNPSLAATTSLPIVTSGLTNALSIAGYLFMDNNSIITTDLFWGNYKLTFTEAYNATIETFPLFKESSFNLEALKEKIAAQENPILLLNFPNNPSGYMPTKEECEEIAKIIKEEANNKNILVILDDAYIDLIYEQPQESLFAHLADIHENVLTIKIDGPTKGDYAWGLRVGFLTFNAKGATKETYGALEQKAAGIIRGNISNASNLSQNLLLKAYESETYAQEIKQNFIILNDRYQEVKRVFLQHPEFVEQFTPLPFNAGYFMCIELKNHEAEPIRQILLKKYDMGIIALKDKIRIAFSAIPKNKIEQAFINIYEACRE
ncbi:MAG: aminotransferase class I/II-fold pyridoxal phosphate-dependent enzyme [Nanoarchaeota archaeon]|nr:aminotransferase class I/II-fold pyridoxal phosphate-dependent enzyme [Nanoarchaeota archaeon]